VPLTSGHQTPLLDYISTSNMNLDNSDALSSVALGLVVDARNRFEL